MCKFYSAIVIPTAGGGFDLLHNPWTHSHEDLIRIYKLRDTARPNGEPRFARIEFSPESMATADDVSTYKLTIDEKRRPDWFSESLEKKVVERMKLIVSAMIVSGDADLLCGGVFILAKGARVSTLKNAYVVVMLDSSKVGEMWDSSQVGEMWGSSKVGEMWGSSKVGTMRDSSKVGTMRDSSKVGEMYDSSKAPRKPTTDHR